MGLSNQIAKMLIQKAKLTRTPISMKFELLPVCNLDCKMCYVRKNWQEVEQEGGIIPADQWIEMGRELYKAGTLFLLLTGGEVFIYPEFKRLYIELYKMGFQITINTNATLIDEEVVAWLKEYPPKCISMSLYGACDETYEALCGRKGMFTKVDKAITLLKDAGITVEAKTILTPLNEMDLEKCVAYIRDKQISYEVAPYSFPAVRKCDKSNQVRFNAAQTAQRTFVRNRLMSNDEQYRKNIVEYLRKYENTKKIPGSDHYGFGCSACTTAAWITWRGTMTPCGMLEDPKTYPFKDGFLPSWEQLKAMTDKIMLSPVCSRCDKRNICTVCPASAYAETGRFDGTSAFHCEMTDCLLCEMQRYAQENHIDIWEE